MISSTKAFLESIFLNIVHNRFFELTGMLEKCSTSEAVYNEKKNINLNPEGSSS